MKYNRIEYYKIIEMKLELTSSLFKSNQNFEAIIFITTGKENYLLMTIHR